MSFFITSDTGSDLSDAYLEKFNVKNLKLATISYTVDDVIYDSPENKLSNEEFYKKMRGGSKLSTSLINTVVAKAFLKPILQDGHDVLHLCFSSGLSGTYNCFTQACEELRKEFPERKLLLVDTLLASLGQGLLVHYIIQMRDEGASIEECANRAEYLAHHLNAYFIVDDLKHLLRTGRTTRTEAFIGTALQIKPVLYMNPVGKLVPIDKAISKKKALQALVDRLIYKISSYEDNPIIFISHGDAFEDAKLLEEKIKNQTPLKNFYIDYIKPTIGSHSGPGTIALFFIGKDRIDYKDKNTI